MQILVAVCLSLALPQEQLFPNPSLFTGGEMFGAADLTGDGVPDVYGTGQISVSDGDFGEAWAFKYPPGGGAAPWMRSTATTTATATSTSAWRAARSA